MQNALLHFALFALLDLGPQVQNALLHSALFALCMLRCFETPIALCVFPHKMARTLIALCVFLRKMARSLIALWFLQSAKNAKCKSAFGMSWGPETWGLVVAF